MCKRMSMLLSVATILFAGVASLSAADKPNSTTQEKSGPQNTKATAQNQQGEHAFLGVAFRPVPKALESQLSGAFPDLGRGGGALIISVMPGSPAEKAGIKPFDIVTSINKQELKSPDDLMKMVRKDSAGQKLALQVVRASKEENIAVTLGERPNSAVIRGQEPVENSAQNGQESANHPESAQQEEVELQTFDALSLERTGKDQYKAEIKFRDKQGKVDTRTFQGNREQIRKDIMAQKDLPRSERRQLLGSLRLPVELQAVPASSASEENNGT